MKDKTIILVVDDQPQNIELLEAYLTGQDYEIVKAANGEEALEILSGNQIDLILLDVMMPGIDGFEVTRRIRRDHRLLPIILVTALRETDDRIKGIEAGCDDFISQPIDKTELVARVRSLLKVKAYNDLLNNYRKDLEVSKISADEAREYAESIIQNVREPLIALDQDLRVVKVSSSFYDVFKVKPEETVGQLIYEMGNRQWDIPKLRDLLEDILPQKVSVDNYEVEHDFATLGRRILLLNARQIKRGSGKERIILLAIEDITERKKMEAEILSISITDQLTGLYNRRGFLSLAEQQLKLAKRNKSGMLLFFIDLDGLKWINDTLGHEDGDKALIEIATVFKETFRNSDIIARLGGDEYAALAVDITEEKSEIFTARLQSLMDTRNNLENRRYTLSISVGYSYYDPDNPSSIDELIVRADKLMYKQKKNKKSGLLFPPNSTQFKPHDTREVTH